MNNHRAQEVEKIYENLKNEPSFCGDDCEDTGGMHGLGVPGSSSGGPLLQPVQVGEIHDSGNDQESKKSVPWNSDEDSDNDFVNPSRDSGSSSEDEDCDGEATGTSAIPKRGGYGEGFIDGMREAVSKINYLIMTQGVGMFHFDGADIFIKKEEEREEKCPKQADGNSCSDTCQEDQERNTDQRRMRPDSISIEMDSDTEDPDRVSSKEFLEILDGGLCIEADGRSKFLSLDSVDGGKFEELKNSKMTVLEWITKLCT
ncbi:phosphoprotein [Matariya virus]|uniref:Phosphoprotein n=1 Tax=Matariya virus TaxID=1272948 RepID=A0AAE8XBN6_9RHAB|nr:phosphoprotein [Matariya virus]UAU42904.1 phosphoprotein [Matariya virus]WAD86864.1 phosphoprotein [Matariya virus]